MQVPKPVTLVAKLRPVPTSGTVLEPDLPGESKDVYIEGGDSAVTAL